MFRLFFTQTLKLKMRSLKRFTFKWYFFRGMESNRSLRRNNIGKFMSIHVFISFFIYLISHLLQTRKHALCYLSTFVFWRVHFIAMVASNLTWQYVCVVLTRDMPIFFLFVSRLRELKNKK